MCLGRFTRNSPTQEPWLSETGKLRLRGIVSREAEEPLLQQRDLVAVDLCLVVVGRVSTKFVWGRKRKKQVVFW